MAVFLWGAYLEHPFTSSVPGLHTGSGNRKVPAFPLCPMACFRIPQPFHEDSFGQGSLGLT